MTPKNFTRRCLLLQRLLEFLKQPHVLDGDDRLVGEGFEQLDLRRREGTYLDATCGQCSNEFSLLTKRNDQEGAEAANEPNVGKSFCARTSGMWSVPCSRIQRNCGSSILISTRTMRYRTKMSPRNHNVPLAESQHHVIDPTNLCGALDDGVEHRLHVRRRAADDAEHLGRRRLMLQRLAQFCVALAEFFEQAARFRWRSRLGRRRF